MLWRTGDRCEVGDPQKRCSYFKSIRGSLSQCLPHASCQFHSKIMTENGWFPKSGQSFPFFQNGLSKVATSQHGQVGWTEDTAKCHVFTKKHGLTLVGWFQDISSWYDVEITIPNRVDFFKESNPPRRFLRSESSLRVLAGFLQGRDLGSQIHSCPTPEVATS